jgi:hypothetical protein
MTKPSVGRTLVVLRTEIGIHASIANEQLEALPLPPEDKPNTEWTKDEKRMYKAYKQAESKFNRLNNLALALGGIQLGDLDDDRDLAGLTF